jgi:hypothetical protein
MFPLISIDEIRQSQRWDVERACRKHGPNVRAISDALHLHPYCVFQRLRELGHRVKYTRKPSVNSNAAKKKRGDATAKKMMAAIQKYGPLASKRLAEIVKDTVPNIYTILRARPEFVRDNIGVRRVVWNLKENAS